MPNAMAVHLLRVPSENLVDLDSQIGQVGKRRSPHACYIGNSGKFQGPPYHSTVRRTNEYIPSLAWPGECPTIPPGRSGIPVGDTVDMNDGLGLFESPVETGIFPERTFHLKRLGIGQKFPLHLQSPPWLEHRG